MTHIYNLYSVREKQYICAFSLGWSAISLKSSKQYFGGQQLYLNKLPFDWETLATTT